ncbi:hypothetical protein CE91St46_14700 [Eubacteriales bacterium]|jgi:hypothetical protein|nr:hypothetical protein CE91St46_14700 [Eubacteriales bacterium]GKH62996.1 hypothetical protein CE91St47_14650 [Eubacteriales bacterium]
MLEFMLDKRVIVKRFSSELGEYNRPKKKPEEIGSYLCHISESNSNTAQKVPQKEATTDLNLYTEPDADIKLGDILYIYELDEYDEIIPSSEYKALADKPYKKRTALTVPLVGTKEV